MSSFVASLLTGTSVPIDLGDGAGMNLLELGDRHLEPDAARRDRARAWDAS